LKALGSHLNTDLYAMLSLNREFACVWLSKKWMI